MPCVMWGPGVIGKPGKVINELATAMDFLPTFAQLSGIDHKPPMPIDGKDISPIVKGVEGAKSSWDRFFYYFGSELHAVREGNWKYRAENILFNENIYRRDEFTTVPIPAALYDLENDVAEEKSVLASHPDKIAHFQSLLNDARTTFGDTLTSSTGKEVRKAGYSNHPVNFVDPVKKLKGEKASKKESAVTE